jgi:hypothetical protein
VAAAATAAAASAASARGAGGFCGAAGDCGAEDGELDRGFFAGALGAGDFLLAVDDYFFELRVALVTDVFVDGHARFLLVNQNDYSKFVAGKDVVRAPGLPGRHCELKKKQENRRKDRRLNTEFTEDKNAESMETARMKSEIR